ncbi:MAG: V-type ATP synthase subunit K [Treponema sp.]|nr:V-type ATP synthase subunit K [Treponema sp.]
MDLNLGFIGSGLAFALSVMGSGIGIGIVGMATVGVWKKTFIANKPASMLLLAFVGNPLTQTFYGYILMGQMMTAATENPSKGLFYIIFGFVAGLAIMITAIVQGKVGAASVDAYTETGGKGFAQYYIVMGIAETVALFTMVLSMISL